MQTKSAESAPKVQSVYGSHEFCTPYPIWILNILTETAKKNLKTPEHPILSYSIPSTSCGGRSPSTFITVIANSSNSSLTSAGHMVDS